MTVVAYCSSHDLGEPCNGKHNWAVFDGWSPIYMEARLLLVPLASTVKLWGRPYSAMHVRARGTDEALKVYHEWRTKGLSPEYLTNPAERKRIRARETEECQKFWRPI